MAKFGYIIKKKIGKTTHAFQVNGDSIFDLVEGGKYFSFPDVYKCGCCGSDNLVLSSHKTEDGDFEYTHITCKDCKARLNFGQGKKVNAVYLRYQKDADGKPLKDERGFTVFDWKPFESNG